MAVTWSDLSSEEQARIAEEEWAAERAENDLFLAAGDLHGSLSANEAVVAEVNAALAGSGFARALPFLADRPALPPRGPVQPRPAPPPTGAWIQWGKAAEGLSAAPPALRVLNLGAGTQSTALLLAACEGIVGPPPDVAMFADTGIEPRDVYRLVERLDPICAKAGIRLEVVEAGSLGEDLFTHAAGVSQAGTPPWFTRDDAGNIGKLRRSCTADYKATPVRARIRELLGLRPGQEWKPRFGWVEQWFGISTDEIERLTDPKQDDRWAGFRYPLIELGWNRSDCARFLADRGITPAKSACVCCPFTSRGRWVDLSEQDPEGFDVAVTIDRTVRHGTRGVRAAVFTHRDAKPLDVAVAMTGAQGRLDLFSEEAEECSGRCEFR